MMSTNTTQEPKLSIVSVNYNGYEDTCEMIESLQEHCHDLSYEIVVVDNGSLCNESVMLQQQYPQITAIRSEVNLGFAGGNNIGIRNAVGKYIMLLNNDTIVKDNSLHYLIERMESSENIGAVSPKIKFASEPCNIQFAGYTPLSKITLRNSLVGFDTPDCNTYDIARPTPYTHGAAMVVSRKAIEKSGLMPQQYFLYYEELDWSLMLSRRSYELWYEPRCTVYHKESRSTGRQSPLRTFYLTRNRMLFAWRNLGALERIASLCYQICCAVPKNTLMFALRRDFTLSGATIKAVVAFFKIKNKMNS